MKVAFDSLRSHGLYSPWNSPGQNTGVGSLSLLQGIFPAQVSRIAGGFFTNWAIREAPTMNTGGKCFRQEKGKGPLWNVPETSVLLNKVCSEEKLSSQGLAYLGEGTCQLQATLAMLFHLRVGSENREAPVKGMVHQLTKKLRPDSRIMQPFPTPNLTLTSLKVCWLQCILSTQYILSTFQ